MDAEERPTILLHFLHLGNCSMHCPTFRHPCRSPGGQMEEVEPRRATAGMQELEQRGRPAGTLEVKTTHDSMARIVLTCMDALMPRTHGCGGAAYNPFAFPPSRQLLHALPYLPPSLSVAWRSDGGGRTASGTAVEERPARVSSAVSCPK